MCGIIGYVGKAEAAERLIEGLSALEYRGYDSAGISVFTKAGKLLTLKAEGRLANVAAKINAHPDTKDVHCGIGHTRWATHGAPSDRNSHPHGTELLQLVHNGIIENYADIKEKLLAKGKTFLSDTDTEVLAVLLSENYAACGNKQEAIRKTLASVTGSYGIAIAFADDSTHLYCARSGSPLIVGVGKEENYVASDITALLRHTKNYYQLREGDIAVVSENEIVITDAKGAPADLPLETANWDVQAAERGGYPHFMIKEINEESETVKKTLNTRIKNGIPDFESEGLDINMFKDLDRVHIVACGTAMFAGCVGKCRFESYARMPAHVEVASEFRYAPPLFGKGDLVIIISQSGETADSLAALRLAKECGAHTLAIVNVIGSSIAREADNVLYTWAGPEISVCSTKAYTVQAALITLLAAAAGLARGTVTEDEARAIASCLHDELPVAIEKVIENADPIKNAAKALHKTASMFFIGRGSDTYLASEGSLKLKEITYTHSEAYAAGELKHGTISLIEEGTPVVSIANDPRMYEKMLSNIREVKARGAMIIAVCSKEAEDIIKVADHWLEVPEIRYDIAGIAAATSLQLLAYYLAADRGLDVDKPRNLAKSVTVE